MIIIYHVNKQQLEPNNKTTKQLICKQFTADLQLMDRIFLFEVRSTYLLLLPPIKINITRPSLAEVGVSRFMCISQPAILTLYWWLFLLSKPPHF